MVSKNKMLSILVIFLVLTMSAASAADVKKNENVKDSEVCEDVDGNEVSEEFGGFNSKGEMLIKRTTKHFAKSSSAAKSSSKTPACYSLARYKRMSFPISYVINPTNTQVLVLTEDFITSAISQSAETWDNAVSRELFNDTYTIDPAGVYGASYDGINTMVFGNNAAPGIIAVANTWYTRRGEVVDSDISFEVDYIWGNSEVTPALMDLQNIATHEIGHGLGLKDLYNTCTDETMYGYSDVGETSKRSLNAGDLLGLSTIYGI